jgi:hypothetical protein
VKWFKLGLEQEYPQMQALPPGLTVQDVVRDYLSALYQQAMLTLYRRFDRGLYIYNTWVIMDNGDNYRNRGLADRR